MTATIELTGEVVHRRAIPATSASGRLGGNWSCSNCVTISTPTA